MTANLSQGFFGRIQNVSDRSLPSVTSWATVFGNRNGIICASEEWIVRYATPASLEFQNDGLLPVSVWHIEPLCQTPYRVVFKPGSVCVNGPGYCNIYSVTGYATQLVDYTDACQRKVSKMELEECYGDHFDLRKTNLPIDLSIPTWWLVEGDRTSDHSDWLLINYKEKKIFEGYFLMDENFVRSCAEFGFTVLHWHESHWYGTPSSVGPLYYWQT